MTVIIMIGAKLHLLKQDNTVVKWMIACNEAFTRRLQVFQLSAFEYPAAL